MSEMIPIKTLNGHPLVDTEARAAIGALGGGGSANVGGGLFIVNGTVATDTPMDDAGTIFPMVVDKSFQEIEQAHRAGQIVCVDVQDTFPFEGMTIRFYATALINNSEGLMCSLYLQGISLFAMLGAVDGSSFYQINMPE
jgi:hypothetical protein